MTSERPKSVPLDVDGATFSRLLAEVQPWLTQLLGAMDHGDVAALDAELGDRLADSLRRAPSQHGSSLLGVLSEVFETALPHTFNTATGRYMAYIPGGGLPTAALADLVASVINRYVTVWVASPGLVQLEQNVIDWMCELVGFGECSGGLLTSGGSMANFSAVVAAREEKVQYSLDKAVMYTSLQAHHSIIKAGRLAGIRAENIRAIPTNAQMQMCLTSLRNQLNSDRNRGFKPFAVVGSAGTTNTGAIDDLEGLSEIASEHSAWFHVDAAYGGFFLLTQSRRSAFAGIERADSVTLDPHKGLFLPYGTGALVVRDRGALRRSHHVDAEYLPAPNLNPNRVDYSAIGPELSRSFRGLRVWLPLELHGTQAFAEALTQKLELAEYAHRRIAQLPYVHIVTGSRLSVRAFRCCVTTCTHEENERLNQEWLDGVNALQRTHISSTRIDGALFLRIAILGFRTVRRHVEEALEDLETVLLARLQAR